MPLDRSAFVVGDRLARQPSPAVPIEQIRVRTLRDQAKPWRNRGKLYRIEARAAGAPSRSWMSAAWTTAPTSSPPVSVTM